MESRNWIKLNRKIFSNNLWEDKEPFDKRSAWIDLLLLANHKDHKIIHDGKIIMAKRGDVNRSMKWLSERWRWDFKKVLRFLRLLESDGMVTRNSTTHGTTITIVNYAKYQGQGITDATTNTPTTTITTAITDGEPRDIYKNDKESKRMCNNDSFDVLKSEKLSPEGRAKWMELRKRAEMMKKGATNE